MQDGTQLKLPFVRKSRLGTFFLFWLLLLPFIFVFLLF